MVVFPQLSMAEIVQIVDLEIAKLEKRLLDKDMTLVLTPVAKDLLAEKGYDPVLGARPLRRTIQRDIEDTLSERILFGQIQVGDQIVVDAEGEGLLGELTFSRRAGECSMLEPIPEVIDIESMTQARAGGDSDRWFGCTEHGQRRSQRQLIQAVSAPSLRRGRQCRRERPIMAERSFPDSS